MRQFRTDDPNTNPVMRVDAPPVREFWTRPDDSKKTKADAKEVQRIMNTKAERADSKTKQQEAMDAIRNRHKDRSKSFTREDARAGSAPQAAAASDPEPSTDARQRSTDAIRNAWKKGGRHHE